MPPVNSNATLQNCGNEQSQPSHGSNFLPFSWTYDLIVFFQLDVGFTSQ